LLTSQKVYTTWKAAYTGVHHIVVWEDAYSGAASQFSLKLYRLNSSNYDAWELNDTYAQADSKAASFTNNEVGSPTKKVNGISNLSVDTPVDNDMFSIYLNAGDKLTVDIEMGSGYVNATHQYGILVEFEDANGWLSVWFDNPGAAFYKKTSFQALVTGWHYITVRSADMQSGVPSVKYKLTATRVPQNNVSAFEFEPGYAPSNDFWNFAYTVTSLTQVASSLDNQLDVDWYYINDAAARTKTIALTNCDANTQMELYEYKNGYLRYIPCEGNAKKIVANLEKNTEYYLIVDSTNWNPNNKNYTVSLTNTQNPDGLALTNTPSYNGGAGAMLGDGNTLSFGMKKATSGAKSYWIEAAAAWGADCDIWGKSEIGKTVSFSGTTTNTITL
jgi:hypothetical protein